MKSLILLLLSLSLPIHAAVTFGTGLVTGSLTVAVPTNSVPEWTPLSDTNVIAWYSASNAYTFGNVLAITNDAPITNWASLGNSAGETNNQYYAGTDPAGRALYYADGGPNNLPHVLLAHYDASFTNNASIPLDYTVFIIVKINPQKTDGSYLIRSSWRGMLFYNNPASIKVNANGYTGAYPVSTNSYVLIRMAEDVSNVHLRINNSTNYVSSVGGGAAFDLLSIRNGLSVSDLLVVNSIYALNQGETNIMNYFNAKYDLWTP